MGQSCAACFRLLHRMCCLCNQMIRQCDAPYSLFSLAKMIIASIYILFIVAQNSLKKKPFSKKVTADDIFVPVFSCNWYDFVLQCHGLFLLVLCRLIFLLSCIFLHLYINSFLWHKKYVWCIIFRLLDKDESKSYPHNQNIFAA